MAGEVRQRRPSPQSQRIGQQPGPVPGILGRAGPLGQGGEPVLVQRVTADPEQVARRPERHQRATPRLGRLQRLPQPADLRLQGAGGMDGKVSAPQVIDQLAGGHGSPQAEQEVSQQGANLCLANLDQPAVLSPGRQGPEHAKTHLVRITGWSGAAACPTRGRRFKLCAGSTTASARQPNY